MNLAGYQEVIDRQADTALRRTFPLKESMKTKKVRLVISANCGDLSPVTVRGLRFD